MYVTTLVPSTNWFKLNDGNSLPMNTACTIYSNVTWYHGIWYQVFGIILTLMNSKWKQRCRETALSPLDRQRQGNALTDNLDSKKEGTRSKNPRFLKNA